MTKIYRNTRLKTVSFLCLIAWVSFTMHRCEEPKKTRDIRAKSTGIKVMEPKSGQMFQYGDTILFRLSADRKENLEIIQFSLYIGNELLHETQDSVLHFDYPTTSGGGGQLKIKATIKYSDGSTTRKRLGINVLAAEKPEKIDYEVLQVLEHNPDAYTQGLYYQNGLIYEGTGNYGRSFLAVYNPITGEKINDKNLGDSYFGEGITLLNDSLYQLTYKSETCLLYDLDLNEIGRFSYDGEGWGLDHNGANLIMSDGSARLTLLRPSDFTVVKEVQVFDHKGPVHQLNELAHVDGFVYANVYTTDRIVKIDLNSGQVVGQLDLKGLLKKEYITGQIDYLNGIAYRPETQTFFVTGKWWPKLFEIRLLQSN